MSNIIRRQASVSTSSVMRPLDFSSDNAHTHAMPTYNARARADRVYIARFKCSDGWSQGRDSNADTMCPAEKRRQSIQQLAEHPFLQLAVAAGRTREQKSIHSPQPSLLPPHRSLPSIRVPNRNSAVRKQAINSECLCNVRTYVRTNGPMDRTPFVRSLGRPNERLQGPRVVGRF